MTETDLYELHVEELKLWLAMMVARHGDKLDGGYRLVLDPDEAAELRSHLGPKPIVIISAAGGWDGRQFVIDIL